MRPNVRARPSRGRRLMDATVWFILLLAATSITTDFVAIWRDR